ncbi:hypothetical protein DB347_23875 [Opitutaceae bacterium EW11]|nr:hypothetical protein DB347_23875 [Opitutaceae bacterium EW11]
MSIDPTTFLKRRLVRTLRILPHSAAPLGSWIRGEALSPSAWSARRSVRRHLKSLEKKHGALAELAALVEQEFTQIGAQLEATVRITDELKQETSALRRLTSDSPVPAAIRLIRESLDAVDEWADSTARLLEGLTACAEHIQRLQHRGTELERAFSCLRTIEIFFKVETATLPIEVQSVFASLSKGMADLQVQAEASFGKEFECVATVKQVIADLTQHVTSLLGQHHERARSRRDAIEATLAELERSQRVHDEQQSAVDEITSVVDRHTSVLVMSLQYQDITRQKMEHVQHALQDLVDGRALQSHTLGALRGVGQACRLQASQLDGVNDDFESTDAHLREGSSGILGSLTDLQAALGSRRDAEPLRAGLTHATETLSATIAELRALAAAAHLGTRRTAEGVKSFAELTRTIAGTTDTLATEIRFIAINAQVQAAHVDNGGSLEVLAQQTCLASDEIGEVSRDVAKHLQEVHARLREFAQECLEADTTTTARAQLLDTEGRRLEEQLSIHRDSALAGLDRLQGSSVRLREQASRWISLRPQDAVSAPLEALRTSLLETADACEDHPAAGEVDGHLAASLFRHSRRYTTEEERRIHATVIGGEPEAVVATASEVSDGNTLSATVARADGPSVAAPESTPSLGDNVELF